MSALSLPAMAKQRSTAPRYIGIGEFGRITGTSPDALRRWLRNGAIWVPTPAVLLGTRLGWEREIAETWQRGLPGVERPQPVTYLTAGQMAAKWHCTTADLWVWVDEGRLSGPAVWLEHLPGWPA